MNRKAPVLLSSESASIAACARPISAGTEIQLFPAGKFRATDGRPKDAPYWYTDASIAAAIIAQVGALANSLVLDYEHQTLFATQNGQPAPAAGWFKTLEWREGDGLYAVDVKWTDRAAAMIAAGEYRYISPVFGYDKKTGAIKSIINAALTNNPALDGMDEVAVRAAASFLFKPKETDMQLNELLVSLRKALGLAETADADTILAHATRTRIDIDARDAEITALKSAADKVVAPDPAKFVPVETMKALQDDLAALRAQINGRDVDGLIAAALTDGRLLPAQEKWARELGGKDVTALKGYLDTTQPIAALKGTQTQGKVMETGKVPELTESQLAICKAMGVSPEDFRKNLPAQE
mgnify:CR=1 FL=1